MKVDAKLFKGIEYVQLSELPQNQRELLTQSINQELFIKLLVDGKIVSGCIQYKDYSKWYVEQYQPLVSAAREQSVIQIQPNLALNKL